MAAPRIAIIGAGIGGLSCAAWLARNGAEVTVFEKLPGPGGKASELRLGGYRFDTGPSLFTMPGVIEEYFRAIGENPAQVLPLVELNPITRYFFADGTVFNAPRADDLPAALEKTFQVPAAVTQGYLKRISKLYDTAGRLFLFRPLYDIPSLFEHQALKSLPGLFALDALRTMDQAARKTFGDKRVVQLFNRYATYNGSSPYRAPATLHIIPWVEYGFGGYLPRGGIHALPRALEAAALKNGAKIRYNTPVSRITLGLNRRAAGVETGGRIHPFDAVVSNADVHLTYSALLSDQSSPMARRYARAEKSSSVIVFYWGIRAVFPEFTVNNILFSPDYPAEFEAIFKKRQMPADPTVYVNITSKEISSDAPAGCENWFVLVNAPADSGQDWKKAVQAARETVLKTIALYTGKDIRGLIECEQVLTPPLISSQMGSPGGSLYGLASNTPMTAFLRQQPRSDYYRGLYFCGGSAHPGGGMPLALLSGRMAAETLLKDWCIRNA